MDGVNISQGDFTWTPRGLKAHILLSFASPEEIAAVAALWSKGGTADLFGNGLDGGWNHLLYGPLSLEAGADGADVIRRNFWDEEILLTIIPPSPVSRVDGGVQTNDGGIEFRHTLEEVFSSSGIRGTIIW